MYSQINKFLCGDISHIFYDNAKNNIVFNKVEGHQYIERSSSFLPIKRFMDLNVISNTPYIFHSTYYRISKNKNAINITTIHDFMYEIYRHDLKSLLHKKQKKKAVFNSDGIICISNNTKKDLLKYYPAFDRPITVIYNGYDDKTYRFKNCARKKTIVYTGGRKGYKSFPLAVKIAREMKEYQFLIIGGGDLSSEEQKILSGIDFTKYGFMSSKDLADIYNEAFIFLYPSEYEGFGITPIEAQACGCLVACQMTSSLPEVVHDTAIPIIPWRLDETIKMIKDYENNHEQYIKTQVAGLTNTKRFSWTKCAQQYYDYYLELFEKRSCKS